MQEIAVSTKLNGVDVDRLFETIDTIKQIPRLADFKFRLHNRWINGGLNRSTINNFYGAGKDNQREEPFVLDADEPPVLLGQDAAPNPVITRVNIDRARTRGIEASARLRSGPLDARLAWTRLSAVSLSAPDPAVERLIRRPRHTLSGDAGVSLGARALLGAGFLVVADRVDEEFNSFPSQRIDPGDYAMVRAYGAIGLGRGLTLRARIENLFDERYEPVYGFPGLGRSVVVSAALDF